MKVLLFFLGVSFFLIFFMFSFVMGSDKNLLGSTFLEANMYILASIFFIFFVFKNDSYRKKNYLDEEETSVNVKNIDIGSFIKKFFSEYVYYIAGGLFYIAMYFILLALFPEVDISGVFLFINIIVLGLYFLESSFDVFQDFIGVNIVVIALYYIVKHLAYLFGFIDEFTLLEIFNIFFLFVFFFIVLYRKKDFNYSGIIEGLLLGFVFLEIVVFYKNYIGTDPQSISFIAFFVGITLLIFTDFLAKKLRIQKEILRSWGIMFLFSFVIVETIIIFPSLNYSYYLVPAFLSCSIILFLFHKRFANYVALSGSIVSFSSFLTLLWVFVLGQEEGGRYLFLLYLLFSLVLLPLHSAYGKKIMGGRYVVHLLSLLVNILGLAFFFFYYDFSILSLGLLLFFESIYLFSSYYIFSKNK